MSYNEIVGRFGEKLAKEHLIRRGYKIIDQNLKTSFKEIDLIARINDLLVIVEVKTRTSDKLGRADEMMSNRKIENLKNAACLYLGRCKIKYSDIRFDFIAVDIDKQNKRANIKHFKDII